MGLRIKQNVAVKIMTISLFLISALVKIAFLYVKWGSTVASCPGAGDGCTEKEPFVLAPVVELGMAPMGHLNAWSLVGGAN